MTEDISRLIMERRDEKEKRVSFILTTLNRADYLDKALMNVREFLTAEDELIIMDGGSVDHTKEIINIHKDIITIFESERDFSVVHAVNKGILKSKGRILVNLNDDDYIYPDGIKRAIKVMEENPGLDALICGGEYCFQDAITGKIKLERYLYLPPCEALVSDIKHIFHDVNPGYFLLNRRVIARIGLFDTTIKLADTEYMSRLIINKANFKYLNIKLYRVFTRPNSISLINRQQADRDRIIIAMRHGEWDEIMKYPLAEIGAALKLNDYPLGNWVLDLIWFKNHLYRHKKLNTIFLKSYLLGIHLLHIITKQIKNFFIHGKRKQYFYETKLPVEPRWDGSLR